MRKDFPSFVTNYVVSIGENGVASNGGGGGNLDLKQVVVN